MLWSVRTTLADRPGSLASLARHCGKRSVNILGLQIFPGVDGVTDELVLAAPDGWALADVAELVESAGGTRVSVQSCTEHALVDGPTRYLTAVRHVVRGGAGLPEVLAELLDAELEGETSSGDESLAPVRDRLAVELGGRRIEVHRPTPFTATEHARATAFAETIDDLHDRGLVVPAPVRERAAATVDGDVEVRAAGISDTGALMSMHSRCSQGTIYRGYGAPLPRLDVRLARRMLVGGGGALVAVAGEAVVGLATLTEVVDGRCEMALLVEDRHQRQGIGTRLLGAAMRRAAAAGAHDVVMRGPAESPGAVATVFGSGLRARVRLTGDELVVTISTRGLTGTVTTLRPTATVTPLRPTPA